MHHLGEIDETPTAAIIVAASPQQRTAVRSGRGGVRTDDEDSEQVCVGRSNGLGRDQFVVGSCGWHPTRCGGVQTPAIPLVWLFILHYSEN